MADPISHVPYDRLVDYALGSLEAPEAELVCTHLAHCPSCLATVQQLLALHQHLRVDADDLPSESVLERIKAIAKSPPACQPAAAPGRRSSLDGYLRQLSLAIALMALAAVAAGTRTLVEQSHSALPGDQLYTVKRTAERVTLATTWNDVSRAQFHVGLIRTRINEILALTSAGRYEAVAASVHDLQSEIDDTAVAFRTVNSYDPPKSIVLAQQVQENLNDSAQKFSTLALAGPPGALPILRSAVQASVAGQAVVLAQLSANTQSLMVQTAPPPTLAAIAATALASTSIPNPTMTAVDTRRPTLTPSSTPTTRPTPTATSTLVATATHPTPTGSATVAPTATPQGSATPSETVTSTPTDTETPAPTSSVSPTATSTASATPSDTVTAQPTETDTSLPTASDTPTATATDTATPLPSETPVPTDTPLPTDTPNPTETPVVTPTATAAATDTPTSTDIPVSFSGSPTPGDTPTSFPTWVQTTLPPGMGASPAPTQQAVSSDQRGAAAGRRRLPR